MLGQAAAALLAPAPPLRISICLGDAERDETGRGCAANEAIPTLARLEEAGADLLESGGVGGRPLAGPELLLDPPDWCRCGLASS
mmetsp:Transcript_13232/g.39706  ORF Transcript_13232/g.39706 Transcript_13232/m.39706 type:complete len:85 (+) Transcript_13232:335-589(+)